ncbi:serine/threonine protein kinase [Vibrio alginolyticus]|uniref:serine/threonine-protein kinase n=1 Tax=Vibrio alginolyticus TaxID=663 RepID=UPI001586C945|nr:serine/threonine-protein kinase [Vibrio alginolyticus]MBS9865609.1 serine/threonine protein kinase [Vibrio alginolyticus]MBS9888825.1 serine/threonine protein kinase [Vibrio alginolyticus]
MEDSNKNNSINNEESGDKTKIVKTQKRDNAIKSTKLTNNETSVKNKNETNTKLSQKENTPLVNKKKNNKDDSLNNNKDVINESLIGTTVKNRYEIESVIGHGGLCDVYLAKDKILESSGSETPYVALKILQKEFASQPETARMLIREAQQTQRLSHPNIIRVFDFGVDGEIYFLVMEYINGETLESLIQRSRPHGLKFNATLSILNQVLDALSYAHSLGVVHADLKPANVILTSEGNVKLLDFGVSKTHQLKQDQYAAKRKSENVETLGYTPNYASLNLLSGKEPNLSDDMFALFCIAYELLSCKHPYARTPVNEALKQKIKVSKPTNMPASKWPIFSSVFSTGIIPNELTPEQLKRKLNMRFWPIASGAAASILLVSGIVFGYQQQQETIATLETVISKQNDQIAGQEWQLDTPAEKSLALIDSEKSLHPVVKAGLLRLHKTYILSEFESEIDQVLNSDANNYPNYDEIESILDKAKTYYPDSHKIEVLALDIQSSKHSTLLSIARQINSQLEKSRYSKEDGSKSIYELKDELNQIHQGYPFTPSSLSSDVFGQHLTEALQKKDAAALVALIKVGNTFFSNVEEHQENLQISNAMKDAVLEMKLYETALDSNSPLPFPEDAARILFQEEFENFYSRLEKARTTTHLDNLVKDVDLFSKNFPIGFQDVNDLRFKTADKYLRFSDILLNKRRTSSARRAMKKANELMKQIEQDSKQS